MMGIQDYDCPQESVLIDTHEGYVLSDRKKTRKRKIAQFINLLLIGLGRPLADIFCKVIPHPGPIPNCLAVDHWFWWLLLTISAVINVYLYKHRLTELITPLENSVYGAAKLDWAVSVKT